MSNGSSDRTVSAETPDAAGALRAEWCRAILHIDMDCFFVAAELLDRPDLRGKPVIVGGAGRRGVVASASYEARAYGVRSAMATATALRQCPHAVVLAGRMERYVDLSAQIMEIFGRFTPLVEPLSLDEAFLDVTGSMRIHGSPRAMARTIRRLVSEELGLSCSVGVATNKSVAKLACEVAKPKASRRGPIPGRGVAVVAPGREASFVEGVPLRALFGIGAATEKRLHRLGIDSVAELRAAAPADLARDLGPALAAGLQERANGIDHRPVVPDQPPKSISNETTFAHDRVGIDEVLKDLVALVDSVMWRCRQRGLDWRTATIKVRFGDFTAATRSRTVPGPLGDRRAQELARELLEPLIADRPVRLIGFGISGPPSHRPSGGARGNAASGDGSSGDPVAEAGETLTSDPNMAPRSAQLSLLDPSPPGPGATSGSPPWDAREGEPGSASEVVDADDRLSATVDSVRARFGRSAVRPARLAATRRLDEPAARDSKGAEGFDETGRSVQPWGPDRR